MYREVNEICIAEIKWVYGWSKSLQEFCLRHYKEKTDF